MNIFSVLFQYVLVDNPHIVVEPTPDDADSVIHVPFPERHDIIFYSRKALLIFPYAFFAFLLIFFRH